MNSVFYEAIGRLPLGTVGAIEFVGPIIIAFLGLKTLRNLGALIFASAGVYILTDLRLAGAPLGYLFALANCLLFMLYILLGHRIAATGGQSGIDRLSAAMLIATLAAFPIGFPAAARAFADPMLLGAGIGVGVSSSVIPYVCDQLAMSRLPRASFALLLSLLPATASLMGFLVLGQLPSWFELLGIACVGVGVGVHQAEIAA
jgi:inner membrane transporter RhtA